MRLLGAVAYALRIRTDVAVLVCAMRRATHKPNIIHVKRLDAARTTLDAGKPQEANFQASCWTLTSQMWEMQHSRKKKKQVTLFEEPYSFAVLAIPILMS